MMIGHKHATEAMDSTVSSGRGAFQSAMKGGAVRAPGASGNENVGISNDRGAGTPPTERPRFPGPCQSARGQPGPKANPKGVVDGQAVNIPLPACRQK